MTTSLPTATSVRSRRRPIVSAVAVATTLLALPAGVDAAPRAPVPAAAATSKGIVGLQLGDRGAAVKKLQRMLQQTGLFLPGGADGIFGAGTEAALKMFQGWNGLDPSGKVSQGTAFWLRAAADGSGSSSASPSRTSSNASSSSRASGFSAGRSASSPAKKLVGLQEGDRGAAVKSLQRKLMKAGVPVTGGADGVFGPATRSAVLSFQGWNGLRATGVVSTATAKAVRAAARTGSGGGNSTAASSPSTTSNTHVGLQQGDRGPLVKELQVALMESGLSLLGGADGIFGRATASTLKLFQKVNGLTQSGKVSKKTAQYLGLGSSVYGVTTTVGYAKFGEVGSRVVALQKALIASGIWVPGGADGVFGGSTAGAVMQLQRREGLAVTGKVDSLTASKLKLNAAPAPSAPSSANVKMEVFPVQGVCWFADTWLAPRGSGRTHQGVDIIAAEGKRLFAVVDGVVSKVYKDYPGSRAGNGLRLEQADGTYFTYLHLSRFKKGVGVGTRVRAGDVIGFNGNTGNSATAHLHFEIHPFGGAAINPYPLLKPMDDCRNTSPTR